MLLTPLDRPFSWKQPPRLALGLCLVLLLIFVPWHAADLRNQQAIADQYRQTLMATEWPLWETHAMKTRQSTQLNRLRAAHAAGAEDPARFDEVALYIALDDSFVRAMRQTGRDYITPAQYDAWEKARDELNPMRNKLSARALGMDPQQDFRPITLLTFGLVQADFMQLAAALLLLLSIGLCMEMALGAGAVLASLLGGGATGALVFWMMVGGDVPPLTGASVGAAAVTGMFLMHFKTGRVRLINRFEIPAYSLAVLWLALVAAEFLLSGLRPSELAARAAALASGPLWAFAYAKWFVNAADFMPVISSEEEVDERDEAYRQHLHQALEAVARLDFAQASKLLREMVKLYPSDMRVLVQLYNVEKLSPEGAAFDAVARRLFNISANDNDAFVLRTYRDYLRFTRTRAALDQDTSLKLAIRFTRMNEVLEADKLMRQILESGKPHPLIQKTALTLADALERLREPARARFLRQAVASLPGAPAAG